MMLALEVESKRVFHATIHLPYLVRPRRNQVDFYAFGLQYFNVQNINRQERVYFFLSFPSIHSSFFLYREVKSDKIKYAPLMVTV